jgi:predicted proteasome-type protease
MCLVRGMIAQTVLRDDPPYFAALLNFWKTQIRQHFPNVEDQAPHRERRAASGRRR